MKGWTCAAIFAVIFCFAGAGWAQVTYSSVDASQRVIVPWTHFGQTPATSPPQSQAPRLQGLVEVSGPAPSSAEPVLPTPDRKTLRASESDSSPRVFEADISKNHPHPATLLKFPAYDQSNGSGPDLRVLSSNPETSVDTSQTPSSSSGLASGNGGALNAGQKASSTSGSSPEAEITLLEANYRNREAQGGARLKALQAAAETHPAEQGALRIEEIRLRLEGIQDRAKTFRQLSSAYTLLSAKLSDGAGTLRDFADQRMRMAQAADAELTRLKPLVARRQLALHNLSMLPASAQNKQIINQLSADLSQDKAKIEFDTARTQQAREEVQNLGADAVRLDQAAAKARNQSVRFDAMGNEATDNEARLEDRLEYSVAQMKAANLLKSASVVLGEPVPGAGGKETKSPSSMAGQPLNPATRRPPGP